jgi:hypothetical protein
VTLLDAGPQRHLRAVPDGVITGPADADNFRVKVGYERWYIDNLPADDRWPADEVDRPSFSAIKSAGGKDWSFLAVKRMADLTDEQLEQLVRLDVTQRHNYLKDINKALGDIAKWRGTIIHWWFEDLLDGLPMRTIDPHNLPVGSDGRRMPMGALVEALTYQDAVADLVRTYKPKLIAAEYVAIHRTLNGIGYGCTPDALVEWDGEIVGIDYKSRGANGDHVCYPEEGPQIAAGVFADYMIVDDGNGGARRMEIPKVSRGLIVSVKPDGCRLYPIDLELAWEHFTKMHAWWVARRTEKAHNGRILPKKSTVAAPSPPHGEVTTGLPPVEQHAEGGSTAPPVPTLGELRTMWATPDEGPDVDARLYEAAANSYKALTAEQRSFVNAVAGEAQRQGVSFHMKERPTLRRFEIMRGLLLLAAADAGEDDVRYCVATVKDTDMAMMPAVAVGWAVGAMGADEARRFAVLADDHVDGRTRVENDRLVVTS